MFLAFNNTHVSAAAVRSVTYDADSDTSTVEFLDGSKRQYEDGMGVAVDDLSSVIVPAGPGWKLAEVHFFKEDGEPRVRYQTIIAFKLSPGGVDWPEAYCAQTDYSMYRALVDPTTGYFIDAGGCVFETEDQFLAAKIRERCEDSAEAPEAPNRLQ
jgi:hypothetical protein